MVILDIIFKVTLIYFVIQIHNLLKEGNEECDQLDNELRAALERDKEDSLVLFDHPELYDADGNLIQESYLVVNFEQQQPPMEY